MYVYKRRRGVVGDFAVTFLNDNDRTQATTSRHPRRTVFLQYLIARCYVSSLFFNKRAGDLAIFTLDVLHDISPAHRYLRVKKLQSHGYGQE